MKYDVKTTQGEQEANKVLMARIKDDLRKTRPVLTEVCIWSAIMEMVHQLFSKKTV